MGRSFVFPLVAAVVVIGVVASNASEVSADGVDDTAVFGGVDRRVQTRDFEGGRALAVFGGVKLDLRDVETTRDEVVVEVTALFGGVEIVAPRDWEVVVRGGSFLGGFEEQGRSRLESGEKHPRLIVTGQAILGGVSVRH